MSSKKTVAKTYQQMADELTKLVDWFESEQVNLDEAVLKYEQAMRLLDDYERGLKAYTYLSF